MSKAPAPMSEAPATPDPDTLPRAPKGPLSREPNIYWCHFNGNGWTRPRVIPDRYVLFYPVLAAFGATDPKLYCAWTDDETLALSWIVSEDGVDWGTTLHTDGAHTGGYRAMAAYNSPSGEPERLYTVYVSSGSMRWTSSLDGEKWHRPQHYDAIGEIRSPQLAAFQDKLVMLAYRPQQSSTPPVVVGAWFDGDDWEPLPETSFPAGSILPSITVFRDKLYCLYSPDTSHNRFAYTTFDGETWSGAKDIPLPNKGVFSALGLFARDLMVCVYTDYPTYDLLYMTTSDGHNWDTPALLVQQGDRPSLAKYGTQLYCAYYSVW